MEQPIKIKKQLYELFSLVKQMELRWAKSNAKLPQKIVFKQNSLIVVPMLYLK